MNVEKMVTDLASQNSWGVSGSATKTATDLLNEVSNGDCKLHVRDEKLVRQVSVLNVEVLCGNHFLVEDRQEFVNGGGVRRRGLKYLAEKFDPEQETIEVAAKRALNEEIGYGGEYEILGQPEVSISDEESKSYPGLRSEYRMHKLRVSIPSNLKDQVRLVEVQPGKKTTFFAWVALPE